ncbi:MAG: MgtC/SapB family protein, partial [Actinobacteria bacterium]
FAVALGTGMLVGLERERSKAAQGGPAGIRTFTLLSLAGAVGVTAAGGWGLAVAGVFVTTLAVLSFTRSNVPDPGMTSEVAMLVTVLLGAFAMKWPGPAAGLGVVVTVLLSQQSRIHTFARANLTSEEMSDALILLAATLVVLPLLPDTPIGPAGVFNPRNVWVLAVLVMAIGTAGHVALRAFGARYGLPLAGFIAGFVSALATTQSMGARAKAKPRLLRECLAAGVLANASTLLGVAILIGITDPRVLDAMARPLGFALAAAAAYALVFAILGVRRGRDEREADGRAFDFRGAMVFVLSVAVTLIVAGALQEWLGGAGLAVGVGLSGFINSQSAAVSAAALSAAHKITPQAAVLP